MSIRVLAWVLRNSEATLGARLVLIVLAEHAHNDGREAYPSVPTIAEEARLSRRSAQVALRHLEAAGHIERDGVGPRGQTKWAVLMRGAESAGVQNLRGEDGDTEGANLLHDGGRTSCTGGGEAASPEPSLEEPYKVEPSSEPPPDPPTVSSNVRKPSNLTYRGKRVGDATADKAHRAFAAYLTAAGRQMGERTGDGRPSAAFKQVIGAVLEHPHVEPEDWERQIFAFVAAPPDWVSTDPPQVGHVFGARAVQWMLDPGERATRPDKANANLRGYHEWFEELRAEEEAHDRT